MLKNVKVNLDKLSTNKKIALLEKILFLIESQVLTEIDSVIHAKYILIDNRGDWLLTDDEETFTESKYVELSFKDIMNMNNKWSENSQLSSIDGNELIKEMERRGYTVTATSTPSIIDSLTSYEKGLLKLYKTIAKDNIEHTLILSGSLAMKLQGVKVTRECRDLDIAVDCKPDEVKLPTSFKLQEEKPYRAVYSKQYINEDGNIVDMFESDEKYDKIGGYKVAKLENIKKNKRLFILRNAFDKKKHEMDIHLIEEEEYLKKK